MTRAMLKDNLGTVAATSRLPSPNIWGDCPLEAIRNGAISGIIFEDDFVKGFITPTITTLINVDGYSCFGSAGATITWDDAAVSGTYTPGGAIILTEATDNESISISTEQHPFWLNSAVGDLWFEARVKTSTITTNQQSFVVGLMDTTAQSATVPLTATGAIADLNFVGFHKPEANTTAFDASYKANGVTAVEVNSDIGTLAVATYIKLGMKYTSWNQELSFYVNNAKQTSTKTMVAAAGTDFPDDIGLAPVLAQTLGASASITMTMDWWRCVQLC